MNQSHTRFKLKFNQSHIRSKLKFNQSQATLMVLDDLEASEAGKRSEEDVAKMFGFEDDYHQGLQIVAF